jgi:hypothetical protein
MRRIPQWFVFAWVIVFGLGSVGGAVFAYSFVRERATELDDVLDLPELPQVSGLNPFAIDDPTETPDPLNVDEAPVIEGLEDGEGVEDTSVTRAKQAPAKMRLQSR